MSRPISVAVEASISGDIEILESYPLAITYKSYDDWLITLHIIHYSVALILPIFYICDIVNYRSHRDIFLLFSIYMQAYILYITYTKYCKIWCIQILMIIIIMMHVIILFEIYKKNEKDIRE